MLVSSSSNNAEHIKLNISHNIILITSIQSQLELVRMVFITVTTSQGGKEREKGRRGRVREREKGRRGRGREEEEGEREGTITAYTPAATGCLLYCSITICTIRWCAVEGVVREGVGTATAVGGCSIDCCWNQLQTARKQTGERMPVIYSKRSHDVIMKGCVCVPETIKNYQDRKQSL